MFTVLINNHSRKVVKQVNELQDGSIKYEAYMFVWRVGDVGSFRLIYNNFGNCTAWKLNTETGIWGCFADQNDIGFDRRNVTVSQSQTISRSTEKRKKHSVTLAQESPPTQREVFEAIEDDIANAFFVEMREHISKLFGVGV